MNGWRMARRIPDVVDAWAPIAGAGAAVTALAVAALGLLAGCRMLEPVAGGTTDTGNALTVAVAGRAVDAQGVPVAGADVRLRDAAYLTPIPALAKAGAAGPGPVSPLGARAGVAEYDGMTDAQGRFEMDAVDPGRYRLELGGEGAESAARRAAGGASLELDLRDPMGVPEFRLDVKDARLDAPARVTGRCALRPGAMRAYVRVYGMERLVPVDRSTGAFALGLPAGRYRLRVSDPECAACAREQDLSLQAGDSLDAGGFDLRDPADAFAAWAHAARIGVDAAAAGVGGNVTGFPMLVRLDASFFDFAQARADGADVRFSKADGQTPLPHEIETWDAAAGHAAIWVRLDTVFGGNAAQSFRMHWGNAAAASGSDGGAVFDTASGFAGVWHLAAGSGGAGADADPDGADAPIRFRDASAHGNHGMGVGMAAGSTVAGAAGQAQLFGSAEDYVRIPDAPSLRFGAGDFTLSAWVRLDGLSMTHQILCKRTAAADYEMQVLPTGMPESRAGREPAITLVPGGTSLATGAWRLLTLRRKDDSLAFFLDGEEDAAVSAPAGNSDNAADLILGQDPGKASGEHWVGALDEVRVMAGAPSRDWIRLCHRSQRPGADLLEWHAER